jgi:hypothetical protein
MRTNAEFVSRIINDIKGLTKDGRVNRRQVLAIGQDKARFLMSQKLDELSMFREEGLITFIPCVEFEEEDLINCPFIDIRLCKTIMKSKKPLPEGLFGKIGAGIIEMTSVDGEHVIPYTTTQQQRNSKNFKHRRKTKGKYILRNNHAYLLDSDIEAVNLTMFVPEPYKTREISACCDAEEQCKSNWDYPFICPDRFLDIVVRDTLTEMTSIYRAIPEDSNPNLDANSKGKDTQ